MIDTCYPHHPPKPLELWGHEASPYTAYVRECLCSLEIPYLYHYAPMLAKEQRKQFRHRFGEKIPAHRKSLGLIMLPLLVDPNTNVTMVESRDIVLYLRKTYQIGEPPRETIYDFGQVEKHKMQENMASERRVQ